MQTIPNCHWLSVRAAVYCLLAAAMSNNLGWSDDRDRELPFRTDANPNSKLPWFQLVPGQFPPEGSAHYFQGELIGLDHLERKFIVRNDRSDAQNRSHWDLPVAASMLPFGSIYFHGAPAALEDIPLGTHLHGWYFLKSPGDLAPTIEGWHNRKSYEVDFTRCLRLEDDFTYHTQQKQLWRIDAVDVTKGKLTATLLFDNSQPTSTTKIFDLSAGTRVWQGRVWSPLDALKEGQVVVFNYTWATLYGPGRLTEIWLDEEARRAATDFQIAKHRIHLRQRGAPGWVDSVDNKQRIVTITFFDNFDPGLLDDFKVGGEAGVAVAENSLLTHDPVNDRKRGPILEVTRMDRSPGCSGMRIRVQPDLLLEGFRPQRIVRVFPSSWPVNALPKEQELFGR